MWGPDARPRTPCSVRDLGRWIADHIHLDLHAAAFKKDDATLVPAAGACTTCPKRTGFAPALFPDVAKKDTCTDPTCFMAKKEAHIARAVAALPVTGKLLHVTHDYNSAERPVLTEGQWKPAKPESCEHVQPVVVVRGKDAGRVLTVCSTVQCSTHFEAREQERHAGGTDGSWARERRAEAAKAKRESVVRRTILEAIRTKVGATLPREALELVATGQVLLHRITHLAHVIVPAQHPRREKDPPSAPALQGPVELLVELSGTAEVIRDHVVLHA